MKRSQQETAQRLININATDVHLWMLIALSLGGLADGTLLQ